MYAAYSNGIGASLVNADAGLVRKAVQAFGGHATLVRGSPLLRS